MRRTDARSAGARHTTYRVAATLAAAVVVTIGIAACGTNGVRNAQGAPGTRLVVRSQAEGAPVASTLDVSCETPVTSSGGTTIASSVVRRFQTVASPAHEWTRTLDVGAGTTCTATDRPDPPAALRSVFGGERVVEGGRLVGVRTTIDGGATVTVGVLAGAGT
jgi:hypothetical protein